MRRFVPALIVGLAAAFGAVRAAAIPDVPGDFLRYHRAGRLVASGRADLLYDREFLASQSVYAEERRGEDDLSEHEFKYAPAMAVMMAPLGALPPHTANAIWAGWNAALIAAMFVVLWRWCAQGLSGWWMLAPLVVLLRPMLGNLNNGQVNPSAIVPATIGMYLLTRGKDLAAGALVGFGTVVKFMPGVLALWLAWKRRWAALAAFLAALVLLGAVLPALVLGPSRSVALTKEWLDVRAHHFTDAKSDDLPGYSVKSFAYRVFGTTPYKTKKHGRVINVAVGSGALSPEALRATTLALNLLVLAAALWFARGPLRDANDQRGPPAAALMIAALPLVSPEARYPHFLYLALPLVALVYALVRGRDGSTRWRVAVALTVLGGALVNATSDKILGDELALSAEIYCAPGWGALAMGVALVLVLAGLRNRVVQENGAVGPPDCRL